MGYNTKFCGKFTFERVLDEKTADMLDDLRDSRHDEDEFPGIWCHLRIGQDSQSLEWDGSEKTYDFIDWVKYANCKILLPRKYRMNGTMLFQGETILDCGRIDAKDGNVSVTWNYTDDAVVNFEFPGHPCIDWVDAKRNIYAKVCYTGRMEAEDYEAECALLTGITIGNCNATTVLVDPELPNGTSIPFYPDEKKGPLAAVMQMSVDSFVRLADSRRGAKEVIEMMAAAAMKKKDNDWRSEFLKMQRALRSKVFGKPAKKADRK